MTITTLYLSL